MSILLNGRSYVILQYFYMSVKSFDLYLMDLKKSVSSFFKRIRVTHLISFDLDLWPQITVVQILNTEKTTLLWDYFSPLLFM